MTPHRLVARTVGKRLISITTYSPVNTRITRVACYHGSTRLCSKTAPPTTTSPKVEELFQKILYLDMIEMHLLTELINEKLGIPQGAARAQMMAQSTTTSTSTSADTEQEQQEQTAFDLKLTAFDAKAKLKVIKEVRAIAGLGLKEAKDLVEGAPKVVKKGIKADEAEELKTKLEKVGATIEIV